MSEGKLQYKNLIYMINVLFGDEAEFIIYGKYEDNMDELEEEIKAFGYSPYMEYNVYDHNSPSCKIMKNSTETFLSDAVKYSISLN